MVGPSFGFRPRNLIDRYLARNARPKAIILYFAPWHLISDRKIADPQWAPLGVYLLRHGSAGDLLRFVSINPAALVELPPILLTGLTSSGRKASAYRGDLVRNRGYLDYNARGKVKPLPANCSPASYERRDPYAVDNRAEVAALRAHYARLGLPVFVYVAPIATCDARIDEVRRAYAGVSDAVPQALPNPFFADDSKRAEHVHPSPAGASEFSRRLADFIKTVVQPKTAEPKVIPPAS